MDSKHNAIVDRNTTIQENKKKVIERLEMLSRLPDDHGGEGETAAKPESFDRAIEFIGTQRISTSFMCTVSTEGNAVFEFHNPQQKYEFADMTFLEDGSVSCYLKPIDGESKYTDYRYDGSDLAVLFRELVG